LGVTPGRTQRDVPTAAVTRVTEVPYDEAQPLCGALTGVGGGSERKPTVPQRLAAGLRGLAVLPPRYAIAQRLAAVSAGRSRRPVLGLGMAGT